MPDGSAGRKRFRDPNRLAKLMVGIASGEVEDKDQAVQALGKKGGKSRAAKLTPERRFEIAKKVAAKRWGS